MTAVLADLNAALSIARTRILAREDELAAVSEAVLVRAGETGARRFRVKVLRHVAASANGKGKTASWSPPHQDEVLDVAAVVQELRRKSDPIRRSAIAEYGVELAALSDVVGVPINWDVTNPLVAAALAGAAEHVGHIGATTRLNLMRTIVASHDAGLTVEETAKAIVAGARAASLSRARLIAITELSAVANGGALAAAKVFSSATGIVLWKRWQVAEGADFPRHEDVGDLDGQVRPLDGLFDVSGSPMDHPGDASGPPDEVCRCRCDMLMVVSPIAHRGT
jgi:hypothetical protein